MTIKYRPRCFFDVELDGVPAGRIVLELFSDVSPITCENFRALCTGEKGLGKTTGKSLHYKGVPFHRVVKDFMVQCGDFSSGNGTGGESIYGGTFKDECFDIKHERPFLLSMANRGKDTNGSQFFITTKPAPHLDGVHVVFGHVISGQEVVASIENQKVDANSKPLADVRVANCGELVPKMKPKEKKRKRAASETTEEGESKSDTASSSEGSVKKKKKKKKRKKSKKHKKDKKRDQSEKQKVEEGEIVGTDEAVCTVKPEEIPDVPPSNFLMRRSSPKEKGHPESKNKGEDDRRRRSSYQKRQHVSRSGRKIKGRGFMRYRTPSRSRSRSRSYTPPHWRQAQARVVPLSEYQKRQGDKPVDEKTDETMPKQRHRDSLRDPEREERNRDSDILSQNGEHESRKETFDRESAAKENVSYPIKYPRAYEGSQSKWDSGEKQEWSGSVTLKATTEYSKDSVSVDDGKLKEGRKFVEEELRKTDDEDDEIKLRNLALSHHLKARGPDHGKSVMQPRDPEEAAPKAKTDLPAHDANWSFARDSKERKRHSSGSSSSSHQSEKRQAAPSAKEKSRSPIRGKITERSPQQFSISYQKESKAPALRKSSSESPNRLKDTALLPEPKSEDLASGLSIPVDKPIKESESKSSPRRKSSSGSPPSRHHKKVHASKSSPKRGRSKSSSPKRSSGKQRKKESKQSPRRGRSSSGSSPSRSRAPRSRSSPRRNRRHNYRDSRQTRRRSRSQSSGSDVESRRQRHSFPSRRRDGPSRFSPRGGRQRRPFRSPRKRSKSDSSSASRSPYRRPVTSRTSPKVASSGDRSRDDGKPVRKSRSASSERAASPRKDRDKSPVSKISAAVTSPLPQRKLVQDYGSPSRHSDSSRSSKSPSKTPPDASTAHRQAQIIAAYHEEEEEIELKPGKTSKVDLPEPTPPPPPPVDVVRMPMPKFLPMAPSSPPPPPPGVEPETLPLPPLPTITTGVQPPSLPKVPEAVEVQDMDLDEDEEEEKKVGESPPIPPISHPAPPGLAEDSKPQPEDKDPYAAPLPCLLEDILLPGEIRSDGQPVDSEMPRIPSPVEAVSMWKAIPEATQPTVEVSTLELLQKQMTEEVKPPEPTPVVFAPEIGAIAQEGYESLKTEQPKFPEKKRSPSTSSKDHKSPTRSKSREKEKKASRRSSSREKSRSKSRTSRSRSRNRVPARRKSRSSSRYRRSSRDSREHKRYNRSRSRQRDRRRRSPSHSRSRSRSRLGGRRRRSKSDSRSRKRSPGRGRRPTGSRYRPYIPRRSSSSRRRSIPRKRSRRRSESRSHSRSRSSSRSS